MLQIRDCSPNIHAPLLLGWVVVLKVWSQTSSISNTWELARNANSCLLLNEKLVFQQVLQVILLHLELLFYSSNTCDG